MMDIDISDGEKWSFLRKVALAASIGAVIVGVVLFFIFMLTIDKTKTFEDTKIVGDTTIYTTETKTVSEPNWLYLGLGGGLVISGIGLVFKVSKINIF